jgi:hypothetical protein
VTFPKLTKRLPGASCLKYLNKYIKLRSLNMPDKGFQESLYSLFTFAFNNQFPLTNVPVYLLFLFLTLLCL